jgi:ribosomal protein S20
MRKAVKRAREAIDEGAADRDQLVKNAVSLVNRAKSRQVIHPGTANRLVSRLMGRSGARVGGG